MTANNSNNDNSLNLFSASEQWRFLPLAMVLCAAETILVGINLLASPPDTSFGISLLVLGSIAALFWTVILFSKFEQTKG